MSRRSPPARATTSSTVGEPSLGPSPSTPGRPSSSSASPARLASTRSRRRSDSVPGASPALTAPAGSWRRRAHAGADTVPVEDDWLERVGSLPITVDVDGARGGLPLALRSTAPGGLCTSSGMQLGLTELPLDDLYVQNVTLTLGLVQARAETPGVRDAMATGTLGPAPVVDGVLDWETPSLPCPRYGRRWSLCDVGRRCVGPDDSRGARTGCPFVWMRVSGRLSSGRPLWAPSGRLGRLLGAPRAHARSSSARAVIVGVAAARREQECRRWPEIRGRVSRQARAAGRRRGRAGDDGRNRGGPRTSGSWIVCRGDRRGGLTCGVVGVALGGVGW